MDILFPSTRICRQAGTQRIARLHNCCSQGSDVNIHMVCVRRIGNLLESFSSEVRRRILPELGFCFVFQTQAENRCPLRQLLLNNFKNVICTLSINGPPLVSTLCLIWGNQSLYLKTQLPYQDSVNVVGRNTTSEKEHWAWPPRLSKFCLACCTPA